MNLGQLRRIRNMSVHRADNQSNDEKLNQFYQYNSIDQIRNNLTKLVNAVKKDINTPANKSMTYEATITTMLASACFIKYNNQSVNITDPKLFNKIKRLKSGDTIEVKVQNGVIVDIVGN